MISQWANPRIVSWHDDHQGMAIELVDAFAVHDQKALAALDASGRAAHPCW